MLFAGIFAFYTVYRENVGAVKQYPTATQIAILPHILLLLSVILINPILRLLRFIRPLTAAELLVVFVMGAVSSGVSTFGMASPLVPLISAISNPHQNNDQSRWDIYIEPYINERFFIAEKGTRAAALALRDADMALVKARIVHRAAVNLLTTRKDLERVRGELAETRKITDPTRRAMVEQPLVRLEQVAVRNSKLAEEAWTEHAAEYGAERVVKELPAQIASLEQEEAARNSELAALEEKAFAIVREFRIGLGRSSSGSDDETARAIPGFIYVSGEGFAGYAARVRRLRHGLAALKPLSEATSMLAEAAETKEDVTKPVLALIEDSRASLERIADPAESLARRDEIGKHAESLRDSLKDVIKNLKILREQRRFGPADEFARLDKEIKRAEKTEKKLKQKLLAIDKQRDLHILPQVKACERVASVRNELAAIAQRLDGGTPGDYRRIRNELGTQMMAFRTFDASLLRFVAGEVPWNVWLRPLGNWACLILLTYLVLMTFNVLIFRQWAHNEKIVYPLAELPTMLAGGSDIDANPPGSLPKVFRNGMFWLGLGISAGVLAWNLLIKKEVITGIGGISLGSGWGGYISGSFLKALLPNAGHEIIFTVVGLSFLVPTKISRSLWSFHLLYMLQLIIVVALGYGVNASSFPAGMNQVLNFRTAEGGGALCVFAAVMLFRCRKYLFCGFRPGPVAELESDERAELRISSWLFMLGSIGLVLILTWGLGANIFYSVLCYLMILIITIGLVRAVAEGGLLGFQCFFGPMHFVRSMFGMNKAWTAPSLMVPLAVYYHVLFLDIKTFIAPAMANALKIRDTLRAGRCRFHLAILLAILFAAFIAVVTHVILAYYNGADAMNQWFYTHSPRLTFNGMKALAQTNPIDTVGGRGWMIFGAVAMAALLYFRQKTFWLPHPIGLIMFVNPIMGAYWFSILLGWIFKSLVSKYGDKNTYAYFRNLFIGLIVGELILCLFGVPLNRN